jgi:hypothetical protein
VLLSAPDLFGDPFCIRVFEVITSGKVTTIEEYETEWKII